MRNDYGVGTAYLSAGVLIQNISRSTGRTTNMLGQVRDGERVVAPTRQVADHIQRELKRLGVEARVDVCHPSFRDVMAKSHQWVDRVVHFDHTWVEALYQHEIEEIRTELFRMQDELSHKRPAERISMEDDIVRGWVW